MTLPAVARSAHALVVDDDTATSFMVQSMLELMGLEVDVASDGRMGADMAISGDYALVMMDVEMPVMDGFDATRSIRARAHEDVSGHINIVGMTGHTQDGIRRLGQQAGMDDLIVKPFLADALHARLKAICGTSVRLDDI